jgi:hypothetical protein
MCPVLLSAGVRHCPKHATGYKAQTNERRRNDEINKWYKRKFWIDFQQWFLRQHPVCARVIDGVRCLYAATIVHHRKSPRTHPELFTTEENCVGLCANHHHGHEGDRGDEVYASCLV